MAVVLAPISLLRNDLKQYTGDAAFALLILLLARYAERESGRRALILLCVAGVVVVPFSTVAGLVAIAAFAGLLVSAAVEQRWHRLREILIGAVASGIGIAAYVAAVVLPHDNDKLRDYWRAFDLSGTPADVLSTAWHRSTNPEYSLGLPPVVILVLFGCGLVVLVTRRHIAIAIATVVLWLEMFALGVAGRYPFLDTRTSHFLLVVTVVVASIGLAGLAFAAVRHRRSPMAAVALVVAGSLAVGARHDIRRFVDPAEDTRTLARSVAAHRTADDIVVVSLSGSAGFTYYWPGREPKTYHRSNSAIGFDARVEQINAVFATGRTDDAVLETMRTTIAEWRTLGGDGRIWIVRSHVHPDELEAWDAAFRALDLRPVAVTRSVEPLLVVDPSQA